MFPKVTARACEVLEKKFSISDVSFSWRRPQQKDHGDLATAICLQLGKQLKKNPLDIAKVLAAGLEDHADIEKVEVAGPGYVNIWLKPATLLVGLSQTISACEPQKKRKAEKPVLIDYSGPNIAKPLGIHHILSTIIGQSIANLSRHLGYETISINHIGDWGTQFGKLAVAYQRWGDKPLEHYSIDELLALYVRFHNEVEKDAALEEEGRKAFVALETGDEKLRSFWKIVTRISLDGIEHLYRRLHVHFDHVHGESFYEDKMPSIIAEGKKKKIFSEGEGGSLIVTFQADEKLPPAIVVKADGSTIYLTRDLATARYRIETWHPKEILYVVDIAQQLHFQQLFASLRKFGWDLPILEHVIFGRMRFADASMSTRKGTMVRLEEVLDEAVERADQMITAHEKDIQTDDRKGLAEIMGVGAVVYGILSQNRKMDIVFDWDKVLSLEGNSAPYLQYTHARAKSVLRKAEKESFALPKKISSFTDRERSLVSTLLEFPGVLEEARASRMPHTLANFLYTLCQEFNVFYNTEPILKSEDPERSLRLFLTSLTAMVLKTGAEILTLRMPERM